MNCCDITGMVVIGDEWRSRQKECCVFDLSVDSSDFKAMRSCSCNHQRLQRKLANYGPNEKFILATEVSLFFLKFFENKIVVKQSTWFLQ